MKVRKNAKKITELREHMLEHGEMSFPEIRDWLNARIRLGITTCWLGNVLAKSGAFRKVGMERIQGCACTYGVTIWEARIDES